MNLDNNHKWIKIDKDREIPIQENYDKFYELVKTVEISNTDEELFPRPSKNQPIPSYGIILVYETEDTYYYFITQQRTTIEFAEIIKCGPRAEFLYEYLSSMTTRERDLILRYSHKELWDALLLETGVLFEGSRIRAEEIFDSYSHILPDLIDYTTSVHEEPPWTFPKGRRRGTDRTLLATALRELKEEADINITEIILLDDAPIFDLHRGTDGVPYSTTYYVIKALEKYEPTQKYLNTNIINEYCLSDDMENYIWLPLAKNINSLKELKDYNLGKRMTKIISNLHKKLIS